MMYFSGGGGGYLDTTPPPPQQTPTHPQPTPDTRSVYGSGYNLQKRMGWLKGLTSIKYKDSLVWKDGN